MLLTEIAVADVVAMVIGVVSGEDDATDDAIGEASASAGCCWQWAMSPLILSLLMLELVAFTKTNH